MNKFFLIILLTISFNANAGWFEDLKKKVGIGYQSYDDCIIGEMKDVQNNNKTLQRAIQNNCRKKFPVPPKPKKKYKRLDLKVTNVNCVDEGNGFTTALKQTMKCKVYYTNDTYDSGWAGLFFKIYNSKSPKPKKYNLSKDTSLKIGYNDITFYSIPYFENFRHIDKVRIVLQID